MAYSNSAYRSFEDLLSRRFNASDEQIKTIIEKNKEIKTNYILQNIQNKLDLLAIFEVPLDEVCENPNFLLMKTNEIFARCKVAKLAGLTLDSELLNCDAPTIDIVNNYLANRDGILINENDIFAPIEEAAMFGEISEEEYLEKYDNKKEKAVLSYAELHRDFKTNCPDLFSEIGSTVLSASSKEKVIAAKKKRPVDPRKLELKEKIRAIYSRDDSSLSNKPKTPRPTLSPIEERSDVVYSSGEPVKNTPFATFFANLYQDEANNESSTQKTETKKQVKMPSHKIESFAKVEKTTSTSAEVKPESSSKKEEDSQNKNTTTQSKQTLSETNSSSPISDSSELAKIRELENTHGYSESYINERQQLCNSIFGLTRADFFKKLNFSTDILDCSSQELYDTREVLLDVATLEERHLAPFVRVLPLPVSEYVAEKVADKIETYARYNLTLDDLSQNFILLRGNIDRTETKIKLAFINHVYSDTFVRGACRNNERAVWARMQAFKEGKTDYSRFYIEEQIYNAETGLNTQDLVEMYPLDDAALAEIDALYNQELANGYKWKKSFRLYSKEIQKAAEAQKQAVASIETNETSHEELEETKNGEPEQPLSEPFKPAKNFEEMTDSHKEKLMEIFGVSKTELERITRVNPELFALNPQNLEDLRTSLHEKYGLTDNEFAKALRTDVSLANRTEESIDEFRKFCMNYLLFNEEQFKEALVKAPEMIGRNKDEIYKRACIIAQELNAPFPDVTNILIRCKRLYTDSTEKLSSKLKKLKTIFTNEEILSHPNAIAVNENAVKIRFMLNMLNNEPVEEFLDRNYFTRESKVYARTMVNFINGLNINVYTSTDTYNRRIRNALETKGSISEINLTEDVDEQIMKLYPLGKVQMKQIERLYNDRNASRKLELTDEEIEHGK